MLGASWCLTRTFRLTLGRNNRGFADRVLAHRLLAHRVLADRVLPNREFADEAALCDRLRLLLQALIRFAVVASLASRTCLVPPL